MPYDGPTLLTSELVGGGDPASESEDRVRPAPGASRPGQEQGDFTRMFGPVKADPPGPVTDEPQAEIVTSFGDSEPPVAPHAPATGSAPPPPKEKGQGEFTRMFGALAEEPPESSVESKQGSTAEPDQPGPSAAPAASENIGGDFTEVFGPAGRPPADPGQSQTLVEPPDAPSPPISREQPPEAGRPVEQRPAKPRIAWRDRSAEETPPRPEEPKVKVRWKKDEPQPPEESKRRPPAAMPQAGPDGSPSPSLGAPPGQGAADSERPATPSPKQPPGQFTEIFGQALSTDAESADRGFGQRPDQPVEPERPKEADLPPYYTGPRKSVSEQVAPLPDRASSDYLRALNGDAYVEPPRVPPAPEPPVSHQERTPPDLPPPLAGAPPPPAPGPSDYTRIVSGQAVQPKGPPVPASPAPAPAGPAPPPAAPAPANESLEPAEPRTPTWLWVALAAIGIVAVLLVVLVLLT